MEIIKTRGRPKKLTNDIEKDIARLKLGLRKWTADEIRGELKTCIFKRIKGKHPELPDKDISREVDEQLPGLSTIQKYIKKTIEPNLKNRPPEEKRLDEPWHLGTLVYYEMPTEAVPLAVFIQETRKNKKQLPLTVRQARWVGRLYGFVSKVERAKAAEMLDLWAGFYAREEQCSQLIDTPIEPSDFDSTVLGQANVLRNETGPEADWFINKGLMQEKVKQYKAKREKEAQNER